MVPVDKFLSLSFAAILSIGAASASAEDVLAFAKRTAGKYASELPAGSLSGTFTSRAAFRNALGFLDERFDRDSGLIIITLNRTLVTLSTHEVFERCTATGSYIGTNAMGAKVRVTRQACTSIFLRGPDAEMPLGITYRDIFGLKLKGSPDLARKLQGAYSYDVEVEFQPEAPDDKDFVTVVTRGTGRPTFTEPTEVFGVGYTIFARVIRVKYYLPGSKTPFAVQDAHPVVDEVSPDPN